MQSNNQFDRQFIEIIRKYIKESPAQEVSFRDYMELCLYHPGYGYYMKNQIKIGRSGDFYTSASIGGLFGEVLAQYIVKQADRISVDTPFTLVEWGGGTGQLAQQLLDELKRIREDIYKRMLFISVEASPYHRMLQAGKLAPHAERVRWLTEQQWLADGPHENTFIYSNELLDAFPAHRVQIKHGQPHEIYVGWDGRSGSFYENLWPLEEGALLDFIRGQDVELVEGQQLEANLEAAAWIRQVGTAIRSGQLVTVDYGDLAEELYAPYRMNGTLMCYRQHTAKDDPYADPGNQDITAHVNFSSLIREGAAAGLQLKQWITQKQFLVDNGLLQKLQDTASPDPFSPAARRNRAVRQLLLSDQMSELFKVLIQEKGELP